MMDVTVLCCVLLVALMGAPGLEAMEEISWAGDVTAGFSTTFTCSSSCQPNCIYTWTFKGHTVNGSTLTWTPDGLDSSVELRCNVLNPETGASSSFVSVVEIKNEVSVNVSPPDAIPSLNQSLDLTCYGSPPGDSFPVVWHKDGQKVTLRKDMQLQTNNLTLSFESLLPSDAGFYQCETYTIQQKRVFSLGYHLSFDPWNVSISGPDSVLPGRMSTFTCLTSCTLNVECTVRWSFSYSFPVGNFLSISGNKLRWTPSIPGTFQNFTCVAENFFGRSAEATILVEVKDIPRSGSEAVQLSALFAAIISLGLLF